MKVHHFVELSHSLIAQFFEFDLWLELQNEKNQSVTGCLQPVSQLALHGLQGLPVKPNAGYEWR